MKKTCLIYTILYPYIYILFSILLLVVLTNFSQYGKTIFFLSLGIEIFISIIFFILYVLSTVTICLKDENLLKKNLIIKLSHIIAHIFLFIFGIILISLIFTIGFAFVIYIGQYLILLLSSTIGAVAIMKNKNHFISNKTPVLYSILQYFYIIDVILSIILYIKIKKISQ